MPSKTDENQALKPRDLPLVLAFARTVKARSSKPEAIPLAQKIHREGKGEIHQLYNFVDSCSTTYTTYKYFFDVCTPSPSSDGLHSLLSTPFGFMGMFMGLGFLTSYSMLAQHFANKKSEEAFKKFIAMSWLYFRDLLKALKNAFRAWESTLRVLNILGRIDLMNLLLPVGIALGILSSLQRILMRLAKARRDEMIQKNGRLLNEITSQSHLTTSRSNSFASRIAKQAQKTRSLGYLGAIFGGFIDGLYLYMGLVSLAVVAFPAFIAMAAMSFIYSAACIINRVFEEYTEQSKLSVVQTKCRLALITKEMEAVFSDVTVLAGNTQKTLMDLEDFVEKKGRLSELIIHFDKARNKLQKLLRRSLWGAFFVGLRHGLYAYSALASLAFLLAGLLFISSTAFPPILLIAIISTGLALLIGFITHSLVVHSKNPPPPRREHPYLQLMDMRKALSSVPEPRLLESGNFSSVLRGGLTFDFSPQFVYQEWFEVVRSAFSGARKGKNFVEFLGGALQERDSLGHYHDSPTMFGLIAGAGLLFSAILGLRGFARELGRSTDPHADPFENPNSGRARNKGTGGAKTPLIYARPRNSTLFGQPRDNFIRLYGMAPRVNPVRGVT